MTYTDLLLMLIELTDEQLNMDVIISDEYAYYSAGLEIHSKSISGGTLDDNHPVFVINE